MRHNWLEQQQLCIQVDWSLGQYIYACHSIILLICANLIEIICYLYLIFLRWHNHWCLAPIQVLNKRRKYFARISCNRSIIFSTQFNEHSYISNEWSFWSQTNTLWNQVILLRKKPTHNYSSIQTNMNEWKKHILLIEFRINECMEQYMSVRHHLYITQNVPMFLHRFGRFINLNGKLNKCKCTMDRLSVWRVCLFVFRISEFKMHNFFLHMNHLRIV